jgi:DNA-3-methyladenine glycosylase
MRRVLGPSFFARDTKLVAEELIGKFLVRKINNSVISAIITETEAYDGFKDLASHARVGKTKRTEVMFGHPGYIYIYLIYGMYNMLNISTREKNYPGAVLIRGIEGTNGPGKLTKILKIDKSFNGLPAKKSSQLWIEDRGMVIMKNQINKTPRIGVDGAGPVWSQKKLRFILS